MIRFHTLATLPAAAILISGCTPLERSNRADDWAQVLTLTMGEGTGAKVRIGPAELGLYNGVERAGLRAGELGSSWDSHDNYDYLWLFYGKECFTGWATSDEPLSAKKTTAYTHYFPFLTERRAPSPRGFSDLYGDIKYESGARNNADLTQIDLALGLGGSLRIGLNPGELLDAILGHIGIDIYRDDSVKMPAKRVSRKTPPSDNPSPTTNRP